MERIADGRAGLGADTPKFATGDGASSSGAALRSTAAAKITHSCPMDENKKNTVQTAPEINFAAFFLCRAYGAAERRI